MLSINAVVKASLFIFSLKLSLYKLLRMYENPPCLKVDSFEPKAAAKVNSLSMSGKFLKDNKS